MSTETLREPEDTWRFQRIFVLSEDGEETLPLYAMVDNCSDRSCLLDRRVRQMGLWNRVEEYSTNQKPVNQMYLRFLHKVTSKAEKDEDFRKSKLRFLHKVIVKVFGFEKSLHCRICIGRGLTDRHRYYSMGTIRLRYSWREETEDGDQIPDMIWDVHDFLVIETSGGNVPDNDTDFDVLMGRDSGICDKRWYQRHIRRRPEERPTLRHMTAPRASRSPLRNELKKTLNAIVLRRNSI